MIQIVKSLLGSDNQELHNELLIILSDENKYTLSPDETDVFNYLNKEFNNNKQFPTSEIFLTKFPQYRAQLDEFDAFSVADLRYYRKQFITKHQNLYKSKMLYRMASEVAIGGITPEMADTVRKQASFEDLIVEDKLSFRERYTKSMKDNEGLKTFVDQIDDEIGSITKGSVCTLAGFTGSGKTTWAVNMAVKNALAGKNIAYISLEVTKEQLEYSIFSLFSSDSRFTRMGYHPLEHQKIRQNKLYEDEINFLCDVLEPEYRRVIEPNLHILDESAFKTFSESEILDALTQLDDQKQLDAVFFDHAGLFAFKSPLYNAGNVGAAINKYVSFIREISICFRIKDGEKRSLASVLLAQTNRSGYKEAARSFRKLNQVNRPGDKSNSFNNQIEGYQLTALSDANELERCSSVVLSVFTNDDLKNANQAYVQMLKTRYGSVVPPTPVDIELPYYKFGGDAVVDESELSVDLIDSLSSCSVAQKSAGTSITVDDDDIFGL
jgi:archaellum biogenesis ATPase FlaH